MTAHPPEPGTHDVDPEQERTEALAALLSAEDTGLQNAGQISMALIGIIAAYLPVSLFAVYQGYGNEILAYLPLPVVLLMFFHMVQSAAMARRTRSAGIVERELVRVAGLDREYARGWLGTPARNPIVNPYEIIASKGDRWMSRYVAAVLPAVGLYAIGIAYTWFLCSEAARLNPDYPTRTWALILPVLLNLLMWSVFLDSAMSYFTPRYKINIWVPIAGLSGIWFQANFPTLGTEPYLYFSLHSAALLTLAALTRPSRWRWHDVIARAGIAGITVSTIGFWLMVFPKDLFRSPEEMVWANVAMHLVLPIVVLLAVWYRHSPLTPMRWRDVGFTMVFPVAYGLVVLVAHTVFGLPIPYSFLDPSRDGLGVTIATCVLTVMVFFVVGSAERFVLALKRPAPSSDAADGPA
ncbi:MAG: Pr6Pr family membrane protein [Propionibacteriaceae bacterium]|nr:Pr6Pr family membrane protein [Propionibacteriaceae bacterium]